MASPKRRSRAGHIWLISLDQQVTPQIEGERYQDHSFFILNSHLELCVSYYDRLSNLRGILSTLGGSQETQNSHDEFRTFLKSKWALKLSKLIKDLWTMPHQASSDACSLVPLPVFGSPTEPFVLLFQPIKHCFLGSNNDSNSSNDQDANSSYVCWLLGNLYKFAFSDPPKLSRVTYYCCSF